MSITAHDLTPSRLKQGDLKQLAETTANPCVSILMRTHRSGAATQQDAIRFKNLLGEARQKLKEAGNDCSILALVESLTTNSDFWQYQVEGLALFLTSENCRLIKLQRSVDEHVSVSDSFFLLPLVSQQNAGDSYFVLALTWDEAKLFRSAGDVLKLVETQSLPAKYHDLVLPRDPEENLQNTSHRSVGNNGGPSKAMFHGHGEGEGKIQADRDRYLSLVGDEVSEAIYNTGTALVVVATAEVAGHFEAATGLTADVKIEGSPSRWSDDEMRNRVNEAVAEQINAGGIDYAERFGTALAQSKGSKDIEEIVTAAKLGRVESVMVCCSNADLDQVNVIVGETLRQGGDVFSCEAEHMPDDAAVAAIFRY
ncbi:baeRF3 domain-containing protein [Rubripirellula reticaptiva]|uniref:Uncharacterized protein n=1 Tax=Rubripirellula reticaptiva TaxID=2528013 RepID=A0A5C6ENF5_9BACT|nr:hypothetical protein [Rubripirellula reticaptiva]TWU51273.1 hypothetical protein Poly59_28650 [Rubripirellula reticaptiva]